MLAKTLPGTTPVDETARLLEQADPRAVMWVGILFFGVVAAGLLVDVLLGVAAWTGRLRREGLPAPGEENIDVPDAWLFVLIILLLNAGALLLVPWLPRSDAWARRTLPLLVQSVAFHGGILLVASCWMKRRSLTAAALLGCIPGNARRKMILGFLCFLGVMPPIFLVSAMWRQLLRLLDAPMGLQDVLLTLSHAHPWPVRLYLFSLAVIIAPIAEEWLFRGILLRAFRKRLGSAWAVLITSVLFAAVHMHLPALLPIFVLSVGLSIAFLLSRSMLVPILMHAFFNAFSLLVMLWLR